MTTRRLAAILAADVAGFSAMMERDEEGTAARIRALRQEVIEPTLAKHHGRLIKTTGDGFLAEFASPVEAVRSALAIQDQLAATEEADGLRLRIGINLGDIIIEDDGDVLGDGVNVAARLEQIAEPGGVAISGWVHDQIVGKVDCSFEDSGEQQVKNIARPVRVYAAAPASRSAPRETSKEAQATDRPSIAVLPFENLSADRDQDYLADGVAEDVIMALTRARWLFVVGRNSSFALRGQHHSSEHVARKLGVQYVLSGSVRKSGERLRIATQLVDARSGQSLWAERYDRTQTDIFALQDEVAQQVAAAIEPELLRTEGEIGATRAEANASAWDLVRRGMWEFHKVQATTHRSARLHFLKATEVGPQSVDGFIWLGRVDAGLVAYGWTDDPTALAVEGTRAALRAIELDDRNPYSHYSVAITHIFSGDYQTAIGAAQRALGLNPTFALGHCVLGLARFHSGDPAGAIPPLERGLALSPLDPQNFTWFRVAAWAYYLTDQPALGLQRARRALELRPGVGRALRTAAACAYRLGQDEEARKLALEAHRLGPPEAEQLTALRNAQPEWHLDLDDIVAKLITRADP